MIVCWFKRISAFSSNAFSMFKLVWRAQPVCSVGIILLSILQGLIPLATAWLMKLFFDLLAQQIEGQTSIGVPQDLLLLLVAQSVLSISGQLIGPVHSYLISELGRNLTLDVQSIIYRKINSFVGLTHFEDPRFYDTIRLASQGANSGPIQTINIVSSLMHSMVTLAGFSGVLVNFSPLLAALVGLATIPHLYAQLKMGRQKYNIASENSPKQRLVSYYGHILSEDHFAKETRLFNLADYFLNLFLQTHRAIHQALRAQQMRDLRWQLVLAILSSLTMSGVFVFLMMQAFSGYLSLGDITLYISAVATVESALLGVIGALSSLNESVLFYSHFSNLLMLPEPMYVADRPRPLQPLTSGIELCDVSFRYSERHPWILRDVNLFIPANKCLALVGLNGAGKTTLVKLLTRLYDPTQGQILWDGVDIREYEPRDLRSHISAIFQDFVQYGLTAQANIGLGKIEQLENLHRVHRAAVQAGIHDTLEALPQGYRTILSRWLSDNGNGANLSSGQWQKIALARMLMRDADLLILDEPTASLDAQAEYEIYSHFVELIAGRTSILISHRFSTVRMADIIAVLEDGRITEYGSHTELLSLGGTYVKLYSTQAELYR